jgi:hypothetical protein
MNHIIEIISHIVRAFAIGGSIGLIVSVFTMMLIKRMAKRAKRYELNYIPMTLVESKLWKSVLIAYPLLFGAVLTILCSLNMLK